MATYTPPANVARNAQNALDERNKQPPSKRGMTLIGLARARQLANREPVSMETIQRMVAYFARHEIDKQGATWDELGPGWQAWHGWGGDEGRNWAQSIIEGEKMEVKAGSRHSEMDMNYIRRARVMSQKSYDSMMEVVEALGDDGAEPLGIAALKDDGEYTPPQIAQINALESIVTEYGKFGQAINQSHYIPANMNGFLQSGLACSSCAFYMKSGGCEIVYGNIEPNGICKLWVIPNNLINEPIPLAELIPMMNMELAPMEVFRDVAGNIHEVMINENDASIEVGALDDRNATPPEREEMPDSNFVIPETRNFVIVTPDDIPAAVASWGRYRGPISFETFKRRIISLATAKGPEFFARLPELWKLELEQRKSYVRELLQVMGVNRD